LKKPKKQRRKWPPIKEKVQRKKEKVKSQTLSFFLFPFSLLLRINNMADGKTLRLVVVTPEKAVLDVVADMVILPMYDGERGVQPGHSPFVGQLGPGELRLNINMSTTRYFVDGGFAQVEGNTVNVLTPMAKKLDELTEVMLSAERTKAEGLPETNAVEKASKAKANTKVAVMTRLAGRR
jgi:F-type H+-transporting ATPase subunit epsilon